jgi:arsenate reductase (glutaredoxin)
MNKITVYGIPNCDTIKKTLDWYKNNNIAIEFSDYKKEGITKTKLAEWCKKVGYEVLLNKKSTTWRSLAPEVQQTITNEKAAIQLMQQYTSLIKRPVVEINGNILVGFNETNFSKQ